MGLAQTRPRLITVQQTRRLSQKEISSKTPASDRPYIIGVLVRDNVQGRFPAGVAMEMQSVMGGQTLCEMCFRELYLFVLL